MLLDHLRVPGLGEPLSASEYAKLENLGEEDDVLEAIRFGRIRGVYFLGKWYLEAPS
jgi:hypothetical protein